jgi:SAM-dependent methyltransferase
VGGSLAEVEDSDMPPRSKGSFGMLFTQQNDVVDKVYPEVSISGFSRIDGTIAFYNQVNALCNRSSVVIDFGAGRGRAHSDDTCEYRRNLQSLKGKAAKVIGVDVSSEVLDNSSLDEAYIIGKDGVVPLPDMCADIIVSDFTFEHIDNPSLTAAEIHRLLKPGGWLCVRTPNRHGYIAVSNRLVPEGLKTRLLKRLQPTREEEDVFPAVYKLNTIKDLQRYFPLKDYRYFSFLYDAEPAYYFNSIVIFRMFEIIQTLSPENFKTMIMLFANKKAA